jgi:hypothetical protein
MAIEKRSILGNEKVVGRQSFFFFFFGVCVCVCVCVCVLVANFRILATRKMRREYSVENSLCFLKTFASFFF